MNLLIKKLYNYTRHIFNHKWILKEDGGFYLFYECNKCTRTKTIITKNKHYNAKKLKA